MEASDLILFIDRARRELCWEREKHLLTDAVDELF